MRLIASIIRLTLKALATAPDVSSTPFKVPAATDATIRANITQLPTAKIIHVVDGDTAIIAKGWKRLTVRLDSIDCPEDGQYWGDIARYGLMKLINRKRIYIEEHGIDPYGRTLATFYVWHKPKGEWLNVNERMVTLGHAWVMRQFYGHLPMDRQDKLNRLENWARAKNVGLWNAANPIPPWQWRSGRQT